MRARTYAWLQDDAPQPKEIAVRQMIEKYGVKAVTGEDVLSPRLAKDITLASNVEYSWNSRTRAAEEGGSWGAWAIDINNKDMVRILEQAFKEYQEYTNE